MSEQVIIKNKAKCLMCNDILESKKEKEELRCKCKRLGVSGGKIALRRNFSGNALWEDLSVVEKDGTRIS